MSFTAAVVVCLRRASGTSSGTRVVVIPHAAQVRPVKSFALRLMDIFWTAVAACVPGMVCAAAVEAISRASRTGRMGRV